MCAAQKAGTTLGKPRERLRGSRGRQSLLPPKPSPVPGAAPAPLPSDSPALQRRALCDAIPSVGFLTCCQLIARKTHLRLQALLAAFPCSLSFSCISELPDTLGAGMAKPGAVLGVLRGWRAPITPTSASARTPAGGHAGIRLIFPPIGNKTSLLLTISIYL